MSYITNKIGNIKFYNVRLQRYGLEHFEEEFFSIRELITLLTCRTCYITSCFSCLNLLHLMFKFHREQVIIMGEINSTFLHFSVNRDFIVSLGERKLEEVPNLEDFI